MEAEKTTLVSEILCQLRQHTALIKGTIFLTVAGVLCRLMGFGYRIYLSRTMGAEMLGLYQLTFSLYIVAFAVTTAGIQTALSRFVAERMALSDYLGGQRYFLIGTGFSLLLSILCSFFMYDAAPFLGSGILNDVRCVPLVRAISFALPFSCLHSCLTGWYFGMKRAVPPAISQLLEQFFRIGGVLLMANICLEKGIEITATLAVYGLIIGDLAATIYSATIFFIQHKKRAMELTSRITNSTILHPFQQLQCYTGCFRQLMTLSLPLTANKVILHLFASCESILLPLRLQMFGYTSTESLSVLGVLQGMALPMIYFPAVLTNSVSVLLLPEIASAQATNNQKKIGDAITASTIFCIVLGLASTLFFLLFGRFIGVHIFQNELAGSFLITLCWICPFLYLTATLTSILNGLGKTTMSFILNSSASGIRILFVLLLVPVFGIQGYLWGMLACQILNCGLLLWWVKRE